MVAGPKLLFVLVEILTAEDYVRLISLIDRRDEALCLFEEIHHLLFGRRLQNCALEERN